MIISTSIHFIFTNSSIILIFSLFNQHQDGTLLDTEALSDQAGIDAFGSALPQKYQEELKGRLPWEIKSKILGLRGSEWIPMVLKYAESHWEVNLESLYAGDEKAYV